MAEGIKIGGVVVDLKANVAALQADMGKAVQVSNREARRMAKELREQTRTAKDGVKLLSQSIGVGVPEGIQKAIASSKMIGPAMAAAFNVAVVGGFAAVIVGKVVPAVLSWTEKMAGLTQALKDMERAAATANQKLLVSFTTTAEGMRLIAQTNEQLAEITRKREELQKRATSGPGILGLLPGVSELHAYDKLVTIPREFERLNEQEKKLRETLQSQLEQLTKLNTTLRDTGTAGKEAAIGIRQVSSELALAGPNAAVLARDLKAANLAFFEFLNPPAANRDTKQVLDEVLESANKWAKDFPPVLKATTQEAQAGFDYLGTIVSATDNAFDNFFTGIALGTRDAVGHIRGFATAVLAEFQKLILKALAVRIAFALIGLFAGARPLGGAPDASSLSGLGLAGQATNMGGGYTFPGRAEGGPVSAMSPYLVGERGPEIFVPNTAGMIRPNASLGGPTVVINQHNDFRGADAGIIPRLREALEKNKEQTIKETLLVLQEVRRRA